jgi:hypothetical protein
MKSSRKIILAFLVLNFVLLTGCVNLVQDVTVHEDGSGSLRFAIGVEASAYSQFQGTIPDGFQLEDLFSNLALNENITDVKQTQYEAGNRTWDEIELQVRDMAQLFADDRTIGPLIFSISLDEGGYIFEQSLDLAQSNLAIPGVNLLDLSGAGYSVRLIAPQIVSTNGIQEGAGVSLWEIPLSDLLQGGESIYLRADYVLESYEGVFIPWDTFFPYVMIGFLALGFLSILVVIIVNTAGKREKPDKLEF